MKKKNEVVLEGIPTIEKSDDRFVSLQNVNKFYDKNVHAVIDFNLDIKKHEFIVFVGPSGCGKSTTLRMIAGLEDITSGNLFIDGIYCNDLTPIDRDIAMVFQSYALYPNMSVYDNMAFSLQVRHFPKDEIDRRVKEAAKILEIENYLDRKPKALSGGQRQRVALGRAIVRKARLFLMDEPLSNLDAKLRVQMRSEIIKLHDRLEATTIYVTHDQTEAMTMADRIVVMKDGLVQQIATPMEIYKHPANKFVASFIGSPAMNFIDALYCKGVIKFSDGTHINLSSDKTKAHDEFYKKYLEELIDGFDSFVENREKEHSANATGKKRKDEEYNSETDPEVIKMKERIKKLKEIVSGGDHEIIFGIRPESIVQNKDGDIKTTISLCELLGDEYYVHFTYAGKNILAKVASETLLEKGEDITFEMKMDKIHLFDYISEKAIL